jgi:nucleoside diphosphate kinase
MSEIFTMIKPEAVLYGVEILCELDRFGKRLESKGTILTSELFDTLYGHLKNYKFYPVYEKDIVGRPIIATIYEGLISDFHASKPIIRNKIITRIEQFENSVSYIRNGIHISDSEENAKREVNFFRQFLK